MLIWRRLCLVALAVWSAIAIVVMPGTIGCAQNQGAKKSSAAWPFASKPKNELVGIKTANQHIEELKALEKKAKGSSPEEQQRITQELSERIQREQDATVRAQIVYTIAAYPTPLASAVLQAALGDTNADVRVACCQAWGRRGGAEAVQELSRALGSDTDIDVRLAATRALGETRSEAAIGALGEALADADPALQHRAVQSLKSVSGRDFGNDVNAWRQFAQNSKTAPPPTVAERLRRIFR